MSRLSRRLAVFTVVPVSLLIMLAGCGASDPEPALVDNVEAAADDMLSNQEDVESSDDGSTGVTATSDGSDEAQAVTATAATDEPLAVSDEAINVNLDAVSAAPLVKLPADLANLTYSEHIEPIVEEACSGCHVGDGAGTGHLRLETAADVVGNRNDIALYVSAGLMPPWLPTDGDVELERPWHINDEELAALATWAKSGAALDVDPQTPIDVPPLDPNVRLPTADLELPLAEPYTSVNGRPDDYRCFVMDELIEEDTFIVGHQFFPDATEIVHHMLFYGVSEDGFHEAQAKDAADAGPGYECFGGPGVGGVTGSLAAWTPGSRPFVQPEGTGLRVAGGTRFVMQIHYHFEGQRHADQSRLILDLAEPGEELTALVGQLLLGPVEIPCLPSQDGPACDREHAVQELLGESLRAAGMPQFLLNWCDNENVTPKEPTELATTSCDTRAWANGEIIRVGAHMHEIGQRFRVILNPDTPDELVLIDIPRWDFNWQGGYNLIESEAISTDDVVRIECTWDRTLRRDDTPRYILWGDGTGQEMCITSLTIRPKG